MMGELPYTREERILYWIRGVLHVGRVFHTRRYHLISLRDESAPQEKKVPWGRTLHDESYCVKLVILSFFISLFI